MTGVDADLTIGIGYETVRDLDTEWAALAARLTEVNATGVTIAVGRPEWVLFDWAGHEETWASHGDDLVAEAIDVLDAGPGGSRELTLVIDALVPQMISEDSDLAAVAADGHTSESFPGAAALATGPVGERIVELCETVADRYRPSRIALTELMIDDSFSADDLDLYADMTGSDDWPRTSDGEIDTDADEIAAWRSDVVADVVGRCVAVAEPFSVSIDMDVRANWDDPFADRSLSGHNHAQLGEVADHLTVWNYFALNDREPGYSAELTSGLAANLGPEAMDDVTMSVGLWAHGDEADGADRDSVLSPEAMVAGLAASLTNGVATVSVTPVSMMTAEHWAALAEWRTAE